MAGESLIGKVYGRLTVIAEAPRSPNYQKQVLCRCECGTEKIIQVANLEWGNTRSCGCLFRELAGQHKRTHGHTHSPEYGIWWGMKSRCLNPNAANFPDYGGRGITICERWLVSFENFYTDMGPRPTPQHSLDRMDNNGPYEKANCRWSEQVQQHRNKRSNRIVAYNGESLTLAEWSNRLSIPRYVLQQRLDRGWSVERAFTTPHAPFPQRRNR